MTLTVFIRVQGQSKAEIQVAAATTQLTKAMVDADRATLEKLAADQLNYGHSGGHIDDKKEFVEKIASGNSDFLSIDLKDQTIIISGKTAIVRHILTAKTHDKGKDPADVHLRVILVWQKQGGQWKLLARQAVKIT
ncbi:MAG: nuclear transport factor 2 family protein [Chitinophagaceae bacterium]|nr:nuclear transport factor 2 family protein [Chitinophagaceae bacterium]MBP8243963.1 nuclear transport factor 2 family protein [Chitinophagaceae bacterium]